MKKISLLSGFILLINSIYAQHEKIVLGEFCYYEQTDGQKNLGDAMPYTYHNRIELKFKSGYQITVKVEEKGALLKILEQYKSKNTTEKLLLGEYKPESISGTSTVNDGYSSVIDTKQSFKIYYDGKKIIIEIPELVDIFGSGRSSNHTIFISKNCVVGLLECLKK